MRVYLHLSQYYEWEPVPAGTEVTEDDVKAGLVMPAHQGGYRMKVARPGPRIRECHINETHIVGRIVAEKSDVRFSGRTLSRKEAVAAVIQEQLLPGHAERNWIAKVEVHDDGPDEDMMHKHLAHLSAIPHARRPGQTIIPPSDIADHKARYAETADHAAHLSAHFGVKP